MIKLNATALLTLSSLVQKDKNTLKQGKVVHVEVRENRAIYVVTNGHYLIIYHEYTGNNIDTQFTIPSDVISMFTNRKELTYYNIEGKDNLENIPFNSPPFPDWRKVMPTVDKFSVNTITPVLDYDYIYNIQKAYRKITRNNNLSLNIMPNVDINCPVLLTGKESNFMGLLMPIKNKPHDIPEVYSNLISS